MFLKECNGTFRVFVWMKCLRLMKIDYWAEHANNKLLFGHKWWNFMEQISHLLLNLDSWECLLMNIIKGRWIFMVLFPKWRIFLWLFWVLRAVLRLCFFRKVFLKSDTAVALRRSLSLILWITLVSFINVYYEYFCKITGCFGIKTLLHVTHQCKLRFLDIQWGKKVFSQPPIVQVLPLKKIRGACHFHYRYTSTMRDKMRKKIQKITL